MRTNVVFLLLVGAVFSSFAEKDSTVPNWHISANVVYSSRSLDGVIVSHASGRCRPCPDGIFPSSAGPGGSVT